jgi:hypothetical protein
MYKEVNNIECDDDINEKYINEDDKNIDKLALQVVATLDRHCISIRKYKSITRLFINVPRKHVIEAARKTLNTKIQQIIPINVIYDDDINGTPNDQYKGVWVDPSILITQYITINNINPNLFHKQTICPKTNNNIIIHEMHINLQLDGRVFGKGGHVAGTILATISILNNNDYIDAQRSGRLLTIAIIKCQETHADITKYFSPIFNTLQNLHTNGVTINNIHYNTNIITCNDWKMNKTLHGIMDPKTDGQVYNYPVHIPAYIFMLQ